MLPLITAIVLAFGVSFAAAAPRISPGDMPGRERERFIDRPGFRDIAPRPPLLVPDSGVKPKSKRKCRVSRKSKRTRRKDC
jgi:hypothetical protein